MTVTEPAADPSTVLPAALPTEHRHGRPEGLLVVAPATLTPVAAGSCTSAAAAGMSGELVAHVLAELPAVAVLGGRDRVLVAAWLASLRSARTRRAEPSPDQEASHDRAAAHPPAGYRAGRRHLAQLEHRRDQQTVADRLRSLNVNFTESFV